MQIQVDSNQILYFMVYLSDYGHNPQPMYNSVETSSHRLEQMMNSNKRWLEKRKKDTNMYPFHQLNTHDVSFLMLGVQITFPLDNCGYL